MAIADDVLIILILVIFVGGPIALIFCLLYQTDITRFNTEFHFNPPKGGSKNWKDWQKRQVMEVLNRYRFAALSDARRMGTLDTDDMYNNSMYKRYQDLLRQAEGFGFREEWLTSQDGA